MQGTVFVAFTSKEFKKATSLHAVSSSVTLINSSSSFFSSDNQNETQSLNFCQT